MFTATVFLLCRLCILGQFPLIVFKLIDLLKMFVCELYLSLHRTFEAIPGMWAGRSVLQMSMHDTAQDVACIVMNKAEGE